MTRLGMGAYGMRPYEVVIECRVCVEGTWVRSFTPTVGATIGRPRKIFIEFIEFIEFI